MMIEAIENSLNLGKQSVDLVGTIMEKIEKYQNLKQDTTAYLRLLYLETINNLDILNTIDFNRFDKVKLNDPKVKALFKLLQTEVFESIFYKNDDKVNNELYNKLKKKGQVVNKEKSLSKNTNKGDEIKVAQSFIYENILQAISFIVVKTEMIRRYSALTDNEIEIFKPLRLKVRLINIKQRLVMIKNTMDTMDEIKDMAR